MKNTVFTALCLAVLVAGCTGGSSKIRTGSQPVHPGDLVRAQRAASNVPSAAVAPTPTAAKTTVAADPALAFNALEQFCVPYVGNFQNATGPLVQAGYTADSRKYANGDGSFDTLYRKPGAGHVIALQAYPRGAIIGCGALLPKTNAAKQEFVNRVNAKTGLKNASAIFRAFGYDHAYEVSGNPKYLLVAATSSLSIYGKGTTYAYGVAGK